MTNSPKAPNNRIIYLDIMRGMAILFILIANAFVFSAWVFLSEDQISQMSGAPVNYILAKLTSIFIDGKWYSIFSILFGIGFVIQYENAKKRNISFPSFFTKRMLGLLLIGLCHIFFLWLGDILTLYALLGFVLIFFRNSSNKSVLIWASILLLMPIVHLLLMVGFDNFYPLHLTDILGKALAEENISFDFDNPAPFVNYWYGSESWSELFTIHIKMPLLRSTLVLLEGRPFKVLACFLIGLWAGRMILQNGILENKALLKKIALYGFLIGIPMNILLTYGKSNTHDIWQLINSISYALGVVPLACAYMAALALVISKKNHYLSIFAPVGQMALTNYISQTIICIMIFYGIGLKLALTSPLWLIILITLTIYAVQILASKLWLRYFRFGPLEWLWRMMTYQRYMMIMKA